MVGFYGRRYTCGYEEVLGQGEVKLRSQPHNWRLIDDPVTKENPRAVPGMMTSVRVPGLRVSFECQWINADLRLCAELILSDLLSGRF